MKEQVTNHLARQTKSKPMMHRSRAFTLVELLVVIAIIGILIGLLVPAIQGMREMARRGQCERNLVQISMALSSYVGTNGTFPAGTVNPDGPIKNVPQGLHHNWISEILPQLDALPIYQSLDRNESVYADANAEVRNLAIPVLHCPSASGVPDFTTCYVGVHASTESPIDEDNDGVFILNKGISDDDVTDGLSYTILLAEKVSPFAEDLGWLSGTRASLRNGGHKIGDDLKRVRGPLDPNAKLDPLFVGGFASDHLDGAYIALGSGEYQFRSTSTDTRILRQMCARADGEIPVEWKSKMPPESDSTASQDQEAAKDDKDPDQ